MPLPPNVFPLTGPEIPAPQTGAAPEIARPRRSLWAVGGGKGGSGKTFITASLGIQLARQSGATLLVDGDWGGANLHSSLGMALPDRSLSDYWEKRCASLPEIVVPTPVANLWMISGAQDMLDVANIKYLQKQKFIAGLRQLPYEHGVVDLGAGTSFNTIDLFLAAQERIAVTLPEPTAVENTYRFLKSAFYRLMKFQTTDESVRARLDALFHTRSLGAERPLAFLDEVERMDPAAAARMRGAVRHFRPWLLVNMTRNPEEERLGEDMGILCRRHLGFEVRCLGHLPYDEAVVEALRRRQAFLAHHPNHRFARHFAGFAAQIIHQGQLSLAFAS